MKLNYIKRIFSLFFLTILISLLFVACPYNDRPYGPYGRERKTGLVYLTVLAPDGDVAIKDTDSEHFKIQYSGRSTYEKDQTAINTEDKLIYILTKIPIYSKDGKTVTDEDIKNALDNEDLYFALRDTRDKYKTVVATYKECYKDHKQYKTNQNSSIYYEDRIDYIYNCEVKLTKK